MMWGPDGFYGGFGIIGGLIMLVFWVAVAYGIVILIRTLAFGGCVGSGCRGRHRFFPGAQEDDPALSILKERFAKGEIDEVEYVKRKKVLEEEMKK